MVAHEPGNKLSLVRRYAKALTGAGRRFHAFNLLVAPSLARVVQQHGEVKRAAVFDQREYFGCKRHALSVHLLHLGNRLNCADRMLIHRVVMIHVELCLRDNPAKLRNGLSQHTRFIHAAENQGRVLAANDGVEDQRASFIRAPNLFVDAPQIARNCR